MTAIQLTPGQQAIADRFHAAEKLERARQVVRENQRYGFPVTKQHADAIRAADFAYDLATRGWAVIER